MAFEAVREVVASTTETSSGNSGAIGIGHRLGTNLNLVVDITAVGGDSNETMDIAIEWSADGGTTFGPAEPADAFGQMTQPEGAQAVAKRFAVKAPHYRIVWTLAGTTPSFTFSMREFIT